MSSSVTMNVVGTLNNVGTWSAEQSEFINLGNIAGWDILMIAWDSQGTMWCVGTANNVGKWNGSEWEDQGFLGGWTIRQLAFDPSGDMWCVGTANNVGKWTGSAWEGTGANNQGSIGNWTINSLTWDSEGNMWCVGTDSNVGKWDGSEWEDQGFLGGWTIRQLAFDPSGNMWCVGTANNVGKWNGSEWEDQGLLGGWTILWLVWGTMPIPASVLNYTIPTYYSAAVSMWSGDAPVYTENSVRIAAGLVNPTAGANPGFLIAVPHPLGGNLAIQYIMFETVQNTPYPTINAVYSYETDTYCAGVADKAISRIEVLDESVAIVFWVVVGSSPTFNYFVADFSPNNKGGGYQIGPTSNGITSLSANTIASGPNNSMIDMSSVNLNGSIYMFWSNAGDSNIYYNAITYNLSATTDILAFANTSPVLEAIPSGNTLYSLDVTIAYTLDDSGTTIPQIAVATLYGDGTSVTLSISLLNPATATIQTLYCEALALGSIGGASTVCITWGSLPGTDAYGNQRQIVLNGLSVVITNNLGVPYLNVVDLSSGNIGPWTDILPPALSNYSPGNPIWYSGLVPTITQATNQTNNALYSVCYMGASLSESINAGHLFNWNIFTGPMPCYTMNYTVPTPSTGQVASIAECQNNADISTAITTWQLLGIITGMPPYAQGNQVSSKISVEYATNGSATSSVKGASSIKGGGNLGFCKTSVTGTTTQNLSQSSALNMTFSFTFPDTPNIGYMLFVQPPYLLYNYAVQTWIGNQPVGVAFQLLTQEGTPDFASYPFNLTNPNEPPEQGQVCEDLCAFPAFPSGYTGWPATTNISEWQNFYGANNTPTSAWCLTSFENIEFSSYTGAPGVEGTWSFVENTDQIVENTSSLTIEASADCKFMKGLLGFNIGGSLTTSSTVTSTVGSSFSMTISYQNDQDVGFSITPQLYLANQTNAPWVPSLLGSQTPWLLTWLVGKSE